MIVDAQIHVWEADRAGRRWPKAGSDGRTHTPQRAVPLSPAEALSAMHASGVDRAILIPPSWEGDRNDCALAAAATHPERFAVMGRVGTQVTAGTFATWRTQPGMLGARVILTEKDAWFREGQGHWLWHARIPLMIAPAGNIAFVGKVAAAHPDLPITVDHMGARLHETGASAFADIDQLLALSRLPNVSVKASCLPAYSNMQKPWTDVMPYLRTLYHAFGAQRLFWGSDLSRLGCPYGELVRFFRKEIGWLRGADRDAVMGKAILAWLGWA